VAEGVESDVRKACRFKARQEVTVIDSAGMEGPTAWCGEDELRDSGLPLIVKLAPFDCFQYALVAQVQKTLTKLSAEVHATGLPVFGACRYSPDDIVTNENVTGLVSLTGSELDVIPLQGQQFAQSETRTERS